MMHNDCDGGHCWACEAEATRRAWFNPGPSEIATPEEHLQMQIEDAVKAALPQ